MKSMMNPFLVDIGELPLDQQEILSDLEQAGIIPPIPETEEWNLMLDIMDEKAYIGHFEAILDNERCGKHPVDDN